MGERVSNVIEGAEVKIDDASYKAAPACAGHEGRWRCVTHGEGFANNLQREMHTDDDREHVLAWICFEHGPEVP